MQTPIYLSPAEEHHWRAPPEADSPLMPLGTLDTPAKPKAGAFTLKGFVRLWRVRFQIFLRDIRSSDIGQIVACGVIGVLVGVLVEAIHNAVLWLHRIDFLLPPGVRLSEGTSADALRVLLVPALGGLLLGGSAWLLRRRFETNIVDPIEANALHGGRMSLRASLRLVLATIVSNAAGASLGLEAGYSQIGAAVFSRLGQNLHLRRDDLRIFVTAGASAAIAAAFDAPLAGAFYGFELVLGSYIPRALAPIAVASLAGTLTQRALLEPHTLFTVTSTASLPTSAYFVFAGLGLGAAAISIVAMRSVTWAERVFESIKVPAWLRPALGGVILSALALAFPQVLGGGYGAIQFHLDHRWGVLPLIALLIAKLVASALSISAGFRGGMFSSSLFLGGLFGAVVAAAVGLFAPELAAVRVPIVIVGMGSVAAGIVGAPLTMAFLVLESTGDFAMTVGVLVGVVMSSTIVRLAFGYSFSTWRFHVRGLPIKGAHDIGWLADLTVDKIMRADPITVPADMRLAALRKQVPLGSVRQVYVTDHGGRYLGAIDVVAAHDSAIDDAVDNIVAGDLAEAPTLYLTAGDNVRAALSRFGYSRQETLPVVSAPDHIILGYLTEAYALRRYMQELERQRSAELGENLFSIGQLPR